MQFWRTGEFDKYASAIRDAEIAHDIPENLLAAILWQACDGFNSDKIHCVGMHPRGAIGIGKLTVEDAKLYFGNATTVKDQKDLRFSPYWSIRAAAWILRKHYDNLGNWIDASVAYHATADCVLKHRRGVAKLPLVARKYSEQILPIIGAH